MKALDRLERWRPWQIALLSVVLTLPAVATGLQLDDHYHRLLLSGRGVGAGGQQIFSLLLRDSERIPFYRDWGTLPWWTPDDFYIAFMRPLSALAARLDYLLWPHSPVAMHAHSLAWLALLVGVGATLYRRLLVAAPVAGLAGMLFAVDEAHAGVAAWVANRNALIAVTFGLGALAAHDRWRRRGDRRAAWLAPLLLAFGLAGGETALGAVGYLVAYAGFVDRTPRVGERWLALLPHGLVVGVWAAAYRLLGYGVGRSGMYVDPGVEPLRFLQAAVERVPFLLLGQWTPLPAELGTMTRGGARWALWGLAVAVAALLAVGLWRVLRRDRMAAFLACGSLAALLPVCGAAPSNRLLLFVGFGASGLVALFVEAALRPPTGRGGRWRWARGLALSLVAVHLFLAAAVRPLSSYAMRWVGEPMARAARELPGGEELADRVLVVVSAPDYLNFVGGLVAVRASEGLPIPGQIRGLGAGPTPQTLERLDAATLRLESREGLLSGPLGDLYADRLPPPGTSLALPGWTVTVRAVEEDGGAIVDYRFDEELEDPRLAWVVWNEEGFVRFTPPGVGERVSLPAPVGPFDGLWGVERGDAGSR